MHDRAFNIGSETNNVTVAEIAQQVAEAVDGSKVVITGETGADPRSYRVDFSRFRAAVPGFACEWTVKRGALELADAYRAHGLTRRTSSSGSPGSPCCAPRPRPSEVDDTLRRRS